jgi:hypothetical protein
MALHHTDGMQFVLQFALSDLTLIRRVIHRKMI